MKKVNILVIGSSGLAEAVGCQKSGEQWIRCAQNIK